MYLAKLLTQCDHQVINRQHLPPLLRTMIKGAGPRRKQKQRPEERNHTQHSALLLCKRAGD